MSVSGGLLLAGCALETNLSLPRTADLTVINASLCQTLRARCRGGSRVLRPAARVQSQRVQILRTRPRSRLVARSAGLSGAASRLQRPLPPTHRVGRRLWPDPAHPPPTHSYAAGGWATGLNAASDCGCESVAVTFCGVGIDNSKKKSIYIKIHVIKTEDAFNMKSLSSSIMG